MVLLSSGRFYFGGLQNHCRWWLQPWNKRCLLLGWKAMTNLDSILKTETLLCQQDPSSQRYGFSSSHVWMSELDYKESWSLKNWCFWTVVLENTLESPLDCKEIKPVNPQGNTWTVIERTDAEAETPIFGHLMQRTDSLENSDAGGEGDDGRWDGWMASPI